MSFTKAGKSVRCVQQDKVASALMGINVKRNIALSVAISAAICGIVGMIVIPLFSIDHNMATMIALKGFSAGVVGGFGTYTGAIVGGITIGVVENLYLTFGQTIYKDVVSFALLILFLVIKPSGITGKKASRGGLIVRKTSSSASLKAAIAEKKGVA
ncbi:High-affinity branched-chain amino acid transport system permease protein LivH [bioreactor metagenome]|uniref:High-affinity branched-chain amino acid transport system permease protein LivH n=1 Tax=bioreactor metagenome TaxID=1076179 RepID=A0A645JMZ9_9ZZZZ